LFLGAALRTTTNDNPSIETQNSFTSTDHVLNWTYTVHTRTHK